MNHSTIKIIALLLVTTMSHSVAKAFDFCVDGLYYNITDETAGTVELTYETPGADNYSGDIVVPASVYHDGKQYTVTRIGEHTFFRCDALTSIVLPETLTSIGTGAMFHCTLLESIDIPASVTDIEASAFSSCSSLKEIALPEDIKTVNDWLLNDCSALEKVLLPAKLRSIGKGAFERCTSLKSIELGEYITEISTVAFSGCSSLESIIIPDAVTTFESHVFSQCTALKEVQIGSRIDELKEYVFSNCTSLEKFVCKSTTPPICNVTNQSTFNGVNLENITLYVPEGRSDAYKMDAPWKNFGEIVETDVTPAEELAVPDGLYFAGTDAKLYHIDNDGNISTIYSDELPHTFQLAHVGNRIYGTSAGTKFTYNSNYQTEGDGKLFYLYNLGDDELAVNIVLNNANGNHNRDPYGLAAYKDEIYVYDRSERIIKVQYSDRTIPQNSYPSWLENSWIDFYGNGWSYGCIKSGMQITEVMDANGNPEPVYWLSIKYAGEGLFRFKNEAIDPSGNRNSSYNKHLISNLSPHVFYLDTDNDYIYFICNYKNSYSGLRRMKISRMFEDTYFDLSSTQLIDDSDIDLEGGDSEPVYISQLSVDNTGEYLYWCYRAPENNFEGLKSGIKRLKLGKDIPVVETVVDGIEGYGVVAVNYNGPVLGAVDNITADTTADGAAEYYNLQGMRIINPQPGAIVIRRQGNNVTKIIY